MQFLEVFFDARLIKFFWKWGNSILFANFNFRRVIVPELSDYLRQRMVLVSISSLSFRPNGIFSLLKLLPVRSLATKTVSNADARIC